MTIFEFTTSSMASILDYTGTLIGNAMPLIVIILGIGIGLWILDHFLLRRN